MSQKPSDKDYRAVLAKNGVSFDSDDEIIDAHYVMRTNDWYVRTAKGWFWSGGAGQEWKFMPYGPSHYG